MKTLKNVFCGLVVVTILSLTSVVTTHAQTRIMVVYENNTSIYDNIAAALANAPAGASVYLPGGRFALDNLKKELHLYGVGYFYPGDPNQRTIIDAFHIAPVQIVAASLACILPSTSTWAGSPIVRWPR